LFLASLVIGFLVEDFGGGIRNFLSAHRILQPFLAAIIGLIPNCAASVAITELYLQGFITYGSVIAGLCASGGLGILVLLKEEKNRKDALLIISLLFAISVIAGVAIEFF